MLVRKVTTNVQTGEVTEEWVDDPNVVDEAQGEILATAKRKLDTNAQSLRDQADQAITNLRAYRDLANPTNAQTVAAVKLLCRVAIALIRLQLAKFDAAD